MSKPSDRQMQPLIIYGLGNNDNKYLSTKHNIGRILLESIAGAFGEVFAKKNDFWSAKLENNTLENNTFGIYSSGYMNESGLPLINFINYFKVQNPLILILQDDSDQISGKVKLLPRGGSAGHHGINSIFSHLPTNILENSQLWRLKIGIRPTENKLRSETFVLNSLTAEDQKNLPKLREIIISEIIKKQDFDSAQNKINAF